MAPTSATIGPNATTSPGDAPPAAISGDALAPVQPGERIAALDILRGFALLGICVINLPGFFVPYGLMGGGVELYPSARDETATFLVDLFGSGKFNSMFSVLFGIGFAIQMERAATKGAAFPTMYLRRLAALFLFGLAHLVFLWDGDVLHIYAAIGACLILVRNWRDRWLWCLVAVLFLAPIVRFTVGAALGEKPTRTPEQRIARGEQELRIYGRGEYVVPWTGKDAGKPPIRVMGESTYPKVVADRVRETTRAYLVDGAAWFWPVMGTTLVIGYIAGRRRFFQDIPAHLPAIRKVAWWSGATGIPLAIAFAYFSYITPRGQEEMSWQGLVAGFFYVLGRPVLCAFYMTGIVLLALRPSWRRLLSPLEAVGRMPLTNYLMQSVIASLLFYGYGVGLYYRIGPAAGVLIAFAIFAVQVAYSILWMSRFRFGPMEWLWRTLTYGKPPAMAAPGPIPASA